ncbi:MAG: NAD kinase [Anaeroplasmataceae bacterium]|nr:NAD kinase [Anaeroplasmataceae bacterium]
MTYWIVYKDDPISNELKQHLEQKIQLELDSLSPNLVIVIGGDGTFISAVHMFPNAIFFGIHTGHLGFYANYTLEEVDQLIEDINHKTYHIEKIDVLQCQLKTSQETIEEFAINEMTLITPPKTLILEVEVDGQLLETFRGTGLCISTAYGSTAYNKSLHGAVVDPNLKTLQITEIAGINSNQYRTLSSPLLLSHKRRIKLETKEETEVFVTIDHLSYQLHHFKSADISLKLEKVTVAYHKGTSYIQRVKRTFLK